MLFQKGDRVVLAKPVTEFDISGEEDKTVVLQRRHPGIVCDTMTQEIVDWYLVDLRGWGQLWLPSDFFRPPPNVTHVAKRNGTCFDALDPMKRKVIGGFREMWRCEVLETRTEPIERTAYYRITLHDGPFEEAGYAGEIWVRAWQWRKLKAGQVTPHGEVVKDES